MIQKKNRIAKPMCKSCGGASVTEHLIPGLAKNVYECIYECIYEFI